MSAETLPKIAEAFKTFAKKQLLKPIKFKTETVSNKKYLIQVPNAYGTSSIHTNDANEIGRVTLDGPRNIVYYDADQMRVHTFEDFNALSVDHRANKRIEIAFGEDVNIDRHEIELNISSTGEIKSDFRIDIHGKNPDAQEKLVNAFRSRGGEMYNPDASSIINLIWDVNSQGYKLEETTEDRIHQTKKMTLLNEDIYFTRQQLLDIGYTHIPEEVIVADGAMELVYDINGKKATITVPSEVPVDLEKSIFENHTIIPHEVVISE